jgi:ABC-type sugar transport system ATPase subunit
MGDAPLIKARGITKSFPGVVALDTVDFDLVTGEIHALAGENGSGKSTFAKILYGALSQDDGTIEIDGEPVTFRSPAEALEHGIVAISQELTLAPTLSVAENILMGRLPRRRGVVNWRAARALVTPELEQLGVRVDVRERVGDLSIELQQEVEIARAVSVRSRVLIFDEATSSLSEAATERLLQKMDQLRAQGVAIIFISHRLRELYTCAQRATVLRDGRLVGTVPLPRTPERELVRMMVGREIADLYGKRRFNQGDPVLKVSHLSTEDGKVNDASFEVREGEILGIAGLVGCGKTELGMALAGAAPAQGEIWLHGKPIAPKSPRHAISDGVGFIPEDRKTSAIFPTRNVRQNFSFAWMDRVARFGMINVVDERRMAERTARRFAVRSRSLDAPIVELSGGNQQKVVLGRWFTLAPSVIVLTEPTRGIDVGAKSEVYGFIQDMAENGSGVLMISSELPELLGLADRVLVMFRGSICAEFDTATAREEEIAHAALGGTAVESLS